MKAKIWIGLFGVSALILVVFFTYFSDLGKSQRAPAAASTSTSATATLSVSNMNKLISADEIDLIKELDAAVLSIRDMSTLKRTLTRVKALDNQFNPLIDGSAGKRKISSDVVRLYAIALDTLPLLHGFLYRLRHIVEPIMPLYTTVISTLRGFKYHSSVYPQHINYLFDYLTLPNPKVDIQGQKLPFKNIKELQDYGVTKIIPILRRKIRELQEVIKNGNEHRAITIVDGQLIIGKKRADEIENQLTSDERNHRRKVVLGTHLLAKVVALQNAIGAIYYFSSYDVDGVAKYTNMITKQAYLSAKTRGVTKFFSDLVSWNNLPSPKEKKRFFDKIRKSNKAFFTLREVAKSNDYLLRAFNWFKIAAEGDYQFYVKMTELSHPSPGSYFFNPEHFKDHKHELLVILDKRVEAFQGKVTKITDSISHDTTMLNLAVLFNKDKVSDLGKFMPTKFEKGKELTGFKSFNFKWNYNYGKILSWPDSSFSGLLPDTQKDPRRVMSIAIGQHQVPMVGVFISLFM